MLYTAKKEINQTFKDAINADYITELKCYDYDKSVSSIIFTELIIIKGDDNHYYIFGYLNDIKGGHRDNKNLLSSSDYVYICIHSSEYKQWNSQERKEITRSQDDIEKIFCKAVDSLIIYPETVCVGSLILSPNRFSENILTGKLDDNAGMLQMAVINNYDFTAISDITKISPSTITAFQDFLKESSSNSYQGNSNNNYQKQGTSGYKAQTYLDKIKDKEQWIVSEINQSKLLPIEVASIAQAKLEIRKAFPEIQVKFDELIALLLEICKDV
jgi:hypothetical protein